MNENALKSVLRRIGIHETKQSRRGWIDFACPLSRFTHANGTDRSMSAGAKINDEGKSGWICHACKNHGSIPHLVIELQKARGVDYSAVVREAEYAEASALVDLDFGSFEREIPEAPKPLHKPSYEGLFPCVTEVPEALEYVTGRGVYWETIKDLGLLYDPKQRRVLFPVQDQAQNLWGFTGRGIYPDVEPKVRDYYGLPKRRVILGEERWKQGKPLILVEGLFGYAHLIQENVETVANVGALLGSEMTPEKATIVRGFDEPTFLLFDNDTGGDLGLFGPILPNGTRETHRGAVNLLQKFVPIFVPDWPEGKDDPDQLTLEEIEIILAETPIYA